MRAKIRSGEDYASNAKPVFDWDDRATREQQVESQADDAYAVLACLHNCRLAELVARARRCWRIITIGHHEQDRPLR